MKTIAAATIAAILLSSPTNNSSVGGALAALLIVIFVMLAFGIHEAWSNGREPLGWIARIFFAFAGGSVGIAVFNFTMPARHAFFKVEVSLAKTGYPLLFI